MKLPWIGAALTYVGAVVGAGFASGQEIWQFFGRHGSQGFWGIALAGLLFFVAGWLALERGRRQHVVGFQALLRQAYPPWATRIGSPATVLFLVLGLGVVAAGGGAAVESIFGLPLILGSVGTILFIVWVVHRGTAFVMTINTVMVPYLILLTLLVALLTWHWPGHVLEPRVSPDWALSAVLYVSYNIFTAIVVLLGVGRTLSRQRDSLLAALLGAAILSLLAVLEHHALLRLPTLGDLPLVTLGHRVDARFGVLYATSLWIALFTTGVAEAYALKEQYGSRVLWPVIAVALFAFVGFRQLIAGLYPVMGAVAVMLWIPLIYHRTGTNGG